MITRTVLDNELLAIHNNIIHMGSLVCTAIERGFQALVEQDESLAREAIAADDEIDRLHDTLEYDITQTMALQQPMASDLRRLIAALLITNELERMGDHAEGIAKTVIKGEEITSITLPPTLETMRDTVIQMIDDVMKAYHEESKSQSRAAAALDDQVDDMYKDLFKTVVEQMGKGELPVDEGTFLLWAGHNLERIGDRVTNISERVIYIRTGEISNLNG